MIKTREHYSNYFILKAEGNPQIIADIEVLANKADGCYMMACSKCPLTSDLSSYKCYRMAVAYNVDEGAQDGINKLAQEILKDIDKLSSFWGGDV